MQSFGLGLARTARPAAKSPPSISFVSHATSSNSASPTIAAMSVGTAAADRVILPIINYNGTTGTPSFGSVTLGGVTATKLQENSPSANDGFALFLAAMATGTTADLSVVITSGTATTDVSAILLRATAINATPYQLKTASATAQSISTTIDCPAGGIIIGCLESQVSAAEPMTWTGLPELDDYATPLVTNVRQLSVAGSVFASAQTGLSVTCAQTTPSANRVMRLILASFAPA